MAATTTPTLTTNGPDHGGTPPAGAHPSRWTLPCGLLTNVYYANGFFGGQTTSPSSCGPSGWYASSTPSVESFAPYVVTWTWPVRVGYYSPAICPSGYTAACSWYRTHQGPTPEPTETAMNCLPEGYVCGGVRDDFDGTSPVPYGMVAPSAPMIPIRWAAVDLTKLETHPLTPGLFMATVSATAAASSAPSAALPTGSPGPSSGSTGLSGGVIAGIAVGAVTVVILVLGAVFLRLRRRQQRRSDPLLDDASKPAPMLPEMDGTALRAEVAGSPASKPAHEIDSDRLEPGRGLVIELPGDSALPMSSRPVEAPAEAPGTRENEAAPNHGPGPDSDVVDRAAAAAPEAGISDSTEAELERLRETDARLEAQRNRLLKLEELESEQARVRQRIVALQRGEGS